VSLNRSMAVVVAFVAAGSQVVSAQSAAAALGLALERQGGGVWQSATRLDPAARFTNPWITLRGDLSVTKSGLMSPLVARDGRLEMVGHSPAWRGFEFSADAHFDRFEPLPDPAEAMTVGEAESALSFRSGTSGAWLGLGLDHSWQGDSVGARPLMSAGLWHQFRGLTLSIGTQAHSFRAGGRAPIILPARDSVVVNPINRNLRDTLHLQAQVVDSGAASHLSRWSDLTTRLSWAAGPVALDALAGFSPKIDAAPSTVWGNATATIGIGSRLSLVATAGSDASRAWLRVPSSRFVNLGVRISPPSLARPEPPPQVRPAAASFTLRPEAGAYLATLHVPSARSVELSGDFNGWQALRLREVRPDVWEATLALSPGTHRVNMRVNGDAWTAPPGLASTNDEFNGTVGLLVVP
jgi:hypothetical protein